MTLHRIYKQCGWVDHFPTLLVLNCLNTRLWNDVVVLVHNSSLLPPETVLMGNKGSEGHWVEVTCLLSFLCLLYVSLCLGCHFLAPIPHWQSKHSTNVTAGQQPFIMCLRLSSEGVFVCAKTPSVPLNWIFTVSLMCLNMAFFQIQLTLPPLFL